MIAKIFNAFLMGIGFVSIIDFLIFISFKINYFDFYEIKEYFNIIFIDNQNFALLLPLSLVVGYLMLYTKKIFLKLYIVVVLASVISLYAPIGTTLAQSFFMQENLRFKVGSTIFSADLLYKGRSYTYLYRKDLQKTVKLKNSEITFLTI